MYFSTGRSNILLALVATTIGFALAKPLRPSAKRLVGGVVAIGLIAVVALIAGGAVIGKTFQNSELATIQSVFTEHPAVESLALPYEYASAPIAAFNELVEVSSGWGRTNGCATLAVACQLAKAAGIDAEPEPWVRPFTGRPAQWNTYSGLDTPLLDGGFILAIPIMAAFGLLAGFIWQAAATGRLGAVVLYGVVGTATALSTGQNRFFAYHFVGCALLSFGTLFLARRLQPFVRKRRSGEATTVA